MKQAKPFNISKHVVQAAYERVKKNKGAAGVDRVSITRFEERLEDNLYKIWNRMSSGSYQPSAVKLIEIPKKQGGVRPLGIPTVADRIAQMVVILYLEESVEPYFHRDSYGYRPRKSALDAIGVTRERCWSYDWVLDIDIKGFFDSINHELMMKAVRAHTKEKWILMYVERWLKAPVETKESRLAKREKGTPQGGVISPLLANLYLHYAFDVWMSRKYSNIKFERYADDIVIHCRRREEAERMKGHIKARFESCGLQMNESKTKIVYCKDANRTGSHENERFDFLGYTFRSRSTRNRNGQLFVSFSPGVSDDAKKTIRKRIKGWNLHKRSGHTIEVLAKVINPIVRGWIQYYGKYHKSELAKVLETLNMRLMKWAKRKYKRLTNSWKKAGEWIRRIRKKNPGLFVHWQCYRQQSGWTIRAV